MKQLSVIPVSKVLSSEYFRAWQTAWLAFEKYEKKSEFNFLPHEDYTKEQNDEKKGAPIPFKKHDLGGNLVIVAHDDPFGVTTGQMGVCYVVKMRELYISVRLVKTGGIELLRVSVSVGFFYEL